MEDVAVDLIESCYNLKDIPDLIVNNIDYDGIARDLEHDGIYWNIDGDVGCRSVIVRAMRQGGYAQRIMKAHTP